MNLMLTLDRRAHLGFLGTPKTPRHPTSRQHPLPCLLTRLLDL